MLVRLRIIVMIETQRKEMLVGVDARHINLLLRGGDLGQTSGASRAAYNNAS